MSGHRATLLVHKGHLSILFSHLLLVSAHSIIEDHDVLRLLDLVVAHSEEFLLFDPRASAGSLRPSLLVLVGRKSILPLLSPSQFQLLGAQALRRTTWPAR